MRALADSEQQYARDRQTKKKKKKKQNHLAKACLRREPLRDSFKRIGPSEAKRRTMHDNFWGGIFGKGRGKKRAAERTEYEKRRRPDGDLHEQTRREDFWAAHRVDSDRAGNQLTAQRTMWNGCTGLFMEIRWSSLLEKSDQYRTGHAAIYGTKKRYLMRSMCERIEFDLCR